MKRRVRRILRPWTRVLLNLWPPIAFAGIHITRLDADYTAADVELRMRPWTRNIVGVHYGGSIFSMTDPFYMWMLMEQLGPEYIVWDKAASIRFRRPGRGVLRAQFRLPRERVTEIRAELDAAIAAQPDAESRPARVEPNFLVEIRDREGVLVAEVSRVLHVQRKAPRNS